MKFAEHLSAHITPEWRKQYIEYEEMKTMLYSAMERQPSVEVADSEELIRYNKAFDEEFLKFCEKELNKINTFFSEKLAEATRKFANLQNELTLHNPKDKNSSGRGPDDVQGEGMNVLKGIFDPRGVVANKQQARQHIRKMHALKLAFSEFYLSLVLLQNYQNLNFTGFRKILKKHDKLLECESGLKWRQAHVDVAPFYTNKGIGKLIDETESVFTNELESGDRQKAMKRLRVPPLNDAQSPWITFKVGFFSGAFIVLFVTVIITGVFRDTNDDWRIVFRLYRGTFLIVLFLFLIGLNVYGWRTSGVNHVLIFELDPRDHLSEQHLIEIATVFSVLWSMSVVCYLYSDQLGIPAYVNPLVLVVGMLLFLVNPTPTLRPNARFWLIRVLSRVVSAPFVRVTFADFWLADQLNSLVPVFLDFQYFTCFYVSSLSNDSWHENKVVHATKCISGPRMIWIRTIVACLPSWFRFAQCLRRYWDDKRRPFPHLVNAMKYSTTFFVVIFATLSKATNEGYENSLDNPYFLCWVFSMCVSSVYTYIWDIKMDWGLFDASAPKEYKFLREEIVYSTPKWYYFAIVEDFVLRFGWTLSVSLTEVGLVHADLMMSILAPLEIIRRFVWNYFRLENEHLNNCGEFRAVRDISIAPIDASDQAKIIKMMDDPDGVVNRRSKARKTSTKASRPRFVALNMNKYTRRPEVRLLMDPNESKNSSES